MKRAKSIFYTPLFILIAFNTTLHAQQKGNVDSAFSAKIDSAWSEIRSNYSDSLQKEYANEFYEYFLQNPDSKTGRKAITSAFMMWGNTGSASKATEALNDLDTDSKIWARILRSVGNSYGRNKNKSWEDYIDLLKRLESELTHPKSRSEVLLTLAENHLRNENFEIAKDQFREVVKIDADSFRVNKALSKLHELSSLKVGQPAPDFTAQTVSGESLTLSELTGKVVVLEFWATWCGPCKPEIPHLKKLHAEFEKDKLQVIGVALDESREKLSAFLKEQNMEWPQIQQSKQWKGEISEKYSVLGIPRSFVIDQTGKIVAKDLRGEKLVQKVKEYIK